MKTEQSKTSILLILTLVIMLYPIYGNMISRKITLSGVTDSVELPQFEVNKLMDGTYQEAMANWYQENFGGRSLLIKLRNQIMYSLLKTSPNSNVIIGGHSQLYEAGYIRNYLVLDDAMTQEAMDGLVQRLIQLDELLSAQGKFLYVFITPSKARFTEDDIPLYYRLNAGEQRASDYHLFLDRAGRTKLKVYDAVRFLEENEGMFQSPCFYATGIHWNHCWGNAAAADFLDYIAQTSGYTLPKLSVSEELAQNISDPNADLYNSQNLFLPAHDVYCDPVITLEREGSDYPSVFLRGGSFMGQSLSMLLRRTDVFSNDVHFENNYYFTDHYSTLEDISSFNAYEEVDLNELLPDKDILILEVNESMFSRMSFGFVDYLLEHPTLLERG